MAMRLALTSCNKFTVQEHWDRKHPNSNLWRHMGTNHPNISMIIHCGDQVREVVEFVFDCICNFVYY